MRNKTLSFNWQSIVLCSLISGMFLSFVLETFFFQTLLFWLLGGFAIYTGIRTRKFYFQWYSVFFAAMFLLRIFALLRQPEIKFSDIELSLSFILFPLIFSLIKIDEKQWKNIQKMVVVGFAVFLCVIIYNYIVHIYLQGLFRESLAFAKGYYPLYLKKPFTIHPSYLAVILAPSIPMCFNLASKAKKNWQQWLWLSFVPVLIFVVFIIGSRIGLIICAGLVILCSAYFFKKLNWVSKLVLILGFLVAIGVFRISTINYTEDPIRKEMNQFAIEKIKAKPFFGYGYNAQLEQVRQLDESSGYPILQSLDDDTKAHFHNQYLEELFQFGFIGFLPFLLLLFYLFYLGIKNRDIYILSFLLIYLLFFFVDTVDTRVKGIMPMMLLIALIMNIMNEQTNRKISQNESTSKI